jgi:hypothetical protein
MMTKCSSVGGNLAPLPLSIVVKSLNSESQVGARRCLCVAVNTMVRMNFKPERNTPAPDDIYLQANLSKDIHACNMLRNKFT